MNISTQRINLQELNPDELTDHTAVWLGGLPEDFKHAGHGGAPGGSGMGPQREATGRLGTDQHRAAAGQSHLPLA
jgi:hypothetical protein